MSEAVYSVEKKQLILRDPELGLDIRESFDPVILPREYSDGDTLEKGMHVSLSYTGLEEPILTGACVVKEGAPAGEMKTFHLEGTLKSTSYYIYNPSTKASLLHGPSQYYSEEGKLVSKAFFVHGVKQGKVERYYASGELHSITRYHDGQLYGMQEYFYLSGAVKSLIPYTEGAMEGECQLYHENGQIYRKIPYKAGKKHGTEDEWKPSGQLVAQRKYQENQVLEERYWNARKILIEQHFTEGDPQKMSVRKWDSQGTLRIEGLFDGDDYEYKEWDEQQKLTKHYLGAWNGESVTIKQFKKGQVNLEDNANLSDDCELDTGTVTTLEEACAQEEE